VATQRRCDASQADAKEPAGRARLCPDRHRCQATCEAAPATLAASVIEVRLAGAVVRVVSGLDDAQLTPVLRAVRASVLRP
jgi:hypothetical protein